MIPEITTPEIVPIIAVTVFLLIPETKDKVTMILNVADTTAANIGSTPLNINGNIKKITVTRVNIRETNDLIPFTPPIIITTMIKIPAKTDIH